MSGSAAERRRQLVADLALLAVSLVWGITFTLVKASVAAFPVFTFLALRFGVALAVLAWPAWRARGRTAGGGVRAIAAGSAFFAGFALQTWGLRSIGPGRAGFITGLSVVLVPLGAALFLGRRPGPRMLAAAGLAVAGLALLAGPSVERPLAPGDGLVLGCAVAFAAHILLVGSLPRRADPMALAAIQVAVVLALSLAAVLAAERAGPLLAPAELARAAPVVWWGVVFTGIFATAGALVVQTRAQQFTSPNHTALIFASEPVFAAIFGLLLAGERLGPRGLAGGGLILLGMVAAELPFGPTPRPAPGSGPRTPSSPVW